MKCEGNYEIFYAYLATSTTVRFTNLAYFRQDVTTLGKSLNSRKLIATGAMLMIAILSYNPAFSQKQTITEETYAIKNNGDTLFIVIKKEKKKDFWKKTITDTEGNKVKISAHDFHEYSEGDNIYVAHKRYHGATIFMKRIVGGPFTLLRDSHIHTDEHHHVTHGLEPSHDYYLTKPDGKTVLIREATFKNQMKVICREYPHLLDLMEKGAYYYESLGLLVEAMNSEMAAQ